MEFLFICIALRELHRAFHFCSCSCPCPCSCFRTQIKEIEIIFKILITTLFLIRNCPLEVPIAIGIRGVACLYLIFALALELAFFYPRTVFFIAIFFTLLILIVVFSYVKIPGLKMRYFYGLYRCFFFITFEKIQ